MQIITVATVKGGAGKTTTAAALAQAAVFRGKRALLIDLDPQADLSFMTGADLNAPGSYELLHGTPAREVIQSTEQGIDIMTASTDLAAEKTTPASALRLQEGIAPIKKNYDLIVIDTPPQISEPLFNGIQAATGLVIPLEADGNNLQGLFQVVAITQQIAGNSNPGLKILGTVLTRYDGRAKLNQYWQETIATQGAEAGAPYLMAIRSGIAVKEAQALQISLFKHAPKSKPALDYMALYEKITGGRKKK